jgi:outer membrane protein
MKRIVPFAAALTLAAGPLFGQSTAPKIGIIDVQRIVKESAVGKESLARVQKLQQAKQDELTRRQKELRDLEQKLADQGKSLSEDAAEKLNKDYQAKALDLKRFQDDATRELEESQRKELKALEDRIMPVISSVGKEQGYTLIFNKFQSGLLHADDSADLTDAVITKFNTQLTVPAASAKPTAAPASTGAKPASVPATTVKPASTPAPKK